MRDRLAEREKFWERNDQLDNAKNFSLNSFAGEFPAPDWLVEDFAKAEGLSLPLIDDENDPFCCEGIVWIPEEGIFAEVTFRKERGCLGEMGAPEFTSISLWIELSPETADKLQWEQKDFLRKKKKIEKEKIEKAVKAEFARRLANKILDF